MALAAISGPNIRIHLNIPVILVVGVSRASGSFGGFWDTTTIPRKKVAQFAPMTSLTAQVWQTYGRPHRPLVLWLYLR